MRYLKDPPEKRKCDYCGITRTGYESEIYGEKLWFCNWSICQDGFIYDAIGRGIIITNNNMGIGLDPLRRNKYEEHRRWEKKTLEEYVKNYVKNKSQMQVPA